MERERRSRAWWRETTARWRQSGLTATEFAKLEGVNVNTLRWWSSQRGHGTRAKHGSEAVRAIEIAVPAVARAETSGMIEIVVGDAVVRCDASVDTAYVASLVRALRGS